MNRAERRRAEMNSVRSYRKQGLPPEFDFPAMFAHTRTLIRKLGAKPDPWRLKAATGAYHAGFERSLASHPSPKPVACRAGCSLCCHNWISVTIPEVLLIAGEVRSRADGALETGIASAADAGLGLDRDQRLERRLACPLLIGGLCSIYRVRPLACRAFFSLSLGACREVFAGTGEDVPTPRNAMVLRGVHDRCFWAALKATGLGHGTYELNHALAIALAVDSADQAWIAGADPFAGATPDQPHHADEELFLDVLIAGARERALPDNPWVA